MFQVPMFFIGNICAVFYPKYVSVFWMNSITSTIQRFFFGGPTIMSVVCTLMMHVRVFERRLRRCRRREWVFSRLNSCNSICIRGNWCERALVFVWRGRVLSLVRNSALFEWNVLEYVRNMRVGTRLLFRRRRWRICVVKSGIITHTRRPTTIFSCLNSHIKLEILFVTRKSIYAQQTIWKTYKLKI